MKSYIITFFILAMGAAASAQMFVDVSAPVPVLSNNQSLDWGDYDNDGDLDLLIAGRLLPPELTPVCKIFRYENYAFQEVALSLQSKYNQEVKFADYDNDGDLDYFNSGSDSYGGSVSTYAVNNNNGNFNEQTLVSAKGGYLGSGDFDGDGDIDVLVSETAYNSRLWIARNDYSDSSFMFVDVLMPVTTVKFTTAAMADFDNDGDLDIIVSGEGEEIGDYHLQIFRNDSALNFTKTDITLPAIKGFMTVVDFDNDNDQDILLSGNHNYNEPITAILRNDSNLTFTMITEGLPQVNGISAFADLNNDTYPDLIVAGISGAYPDFITVTDILLNAGDGTFTASGAIVLPLNAGSLATGDYDADGDIDFAIAGADAFLEPGYHLTVYANTYILSDDKESVSQIQLYPNPVNDVFKISLPQPAKELTIALHSASGQLLKINKYSNCTTVEDNLSTLPAGVYVLTIKTETLQRSYKIVR